MSFPPPRVAPLVLGAATIDPPLFLAPLAGICDRHYRLIVRRLGGVGLVSMEFISADAVTRGSAAMIEKMRFAEEERPLSIQIYGRDPERMAACAELVEALRPDVCDINMGCPANKVLKGCSGAALMGDLPRAAKIVEACRRRLSIPLTVKFRMGLGKGDEPVNYLELGRICQDLGVAAVALHGRTAKQMFSGAADWDAIARLKRELAIPVIGNGDVKTPEDALEMFRRTGCDGVMVGRGALADPWIFRRAAALLAGRPAPPATLAERRALILEHFGWIVRDEPPPEALHKLRTFLGWYTRGVPGGRRLRGLINDLKAPELFLEAVEEHFAALDRAGADRAPDEP